MPDYRPDEVIGEELRFASALHGSPFAGRVLPPQYIFNQGWRHNGKKLTNDAVAAVARKRITEMLFFEPTETELKYLVDGVLGARHSADPGLRFMHRFFTPTEGSNARLSTAWAVWCAWPTRLPGVSEAQFRQLLSDSGIQTDGGYILNWRL